MQVRAFERYIPLSMHMQLSIVGSQVRFPASPGPHSVSLRCSRHIIHTQTINPPGPVLVTAQEKPQKVYF